MSLRESRALSIIGFGLVGLALLSFSLRVVYMVWTGHGGDTYTSARNWVWSYSSALVVVVAVAAVVMVALVTHIWHRFRGH